MRKYFLIAALAACFLQVCAQINSESQKKDSVRIDNLKHELQHLKGSARIDTMLLLCIYFKYGSPRTGQITGAADSLKYYASHAYNESKSIGYKKGIAGALLCLNADSVKEKNIHEAIRIGKEINDNEILGWAYYDLPSKNHSEHLENFTKAITYFHQAGDTLRETEVTFWLFVDYINSGELEKAFDYGKRCVILSQSQKNPKYFIDFYYIQTQGILSQMSNLYSAVGDYETSINFLRQNEVYGIANNTTYQDFSPNMAEVYCDKEDADSAYYYSDTTRFADQWSKMNPGEKAWGRGVMGRALLLNKKYNDAFKLFVSTIDFFKKVQNPVAISGPILYLGQAYEGLNDYASALKYAKEGLGHAKKWNLRPETMQGYKLLSSIYHRLGENDSAYSYLLKYIALKDSIQNKQFLLRLYNYKSEIENAQKESRIGILNRDNQLKKQQLKQEATFRNFIIAAFIALLFAGLYFFRNISLKRRNEKLKQEQKEQEWKVKELESENRHVELQKQSAELEMQALRAQMNPHFIFNSLSSINHFILKNESKTASNYLTRFSRLIRMVLINSQKSMISLQEELEMLGIYLEMERLRFKNSFDYGITFLNKIDSDNIFIPPLLLQPFCENAIWHGLMNMDEQGRLDIQLSMENNTLNCTITDNGIGREKAEEMKSKSAEKEKSMGLKITGDRLNLLNREKGIHTFYSIEDLKDGAGNAIGTRVNLKISYNEIKEIVNK